jgi:putative NIF3 family GTP cyclohydrolase 1 type 2
MITIKEVVDFIFEIAPDPQPPASTENKLMVGDPGMEVHGIAVMWRPIPKLLIEAAQSGANLIIGHEDMLSPVQKNYWWGTVVSDEMMPVNRDIEALMHKYGLSFARFHSNIDVAPWGMPIALLRKLGFDLVALKWSKYIPMVTIPEMTVGQLAERCKKKLELSHLRVVGDLNKVVRKPAVVWGGLSRVNAGVSSAVYLGADVILGGDLTDAAAITSELCGIPVIECGHAHSEMPAMMELTTRLQQRFPMLNVRFLSNREPWSVVV